MKKYLWLFILLFSVPLMANSFTVDVAAVFGPSDLSPSYGAWVQNWFSAQGIGTNSAGNPDSPTYYDGQKDSAANVLKTNFPSWEGKANPGTVFGSNFANELGNSVYFTYHIYGDSAFSTSQVFFTVSSSAPVSWQTYFFGYAPYSANNLGLNYGPDGIKGTVDDFWITGGSPVQPVNEILGVGSGVYQGVRCVSCAPQSVLDLVQSYFPQYDIVGQYTLKSGGLPIASGSDTFFVHPMVSNTVPELSSISLFGTGLICLIGRKLIRR